MKKFLSALLVLMMVCSLCVSAFAVSPAAQPVNEETTAALPEAVPEELTVTKDGKEETIVGFGIYDAATDALEDVIPAADLKLIPVADAKKELKEKDAEKFLAEYEKVKAIKDQVVKYFAWIKVPEEFKIDADNYLKFVFKCKGENVKVTVNGEEMKVEPVEGQKDTYFAKLTKLGAIAILCDKDKK